MNATFELVVRNQAGVRTILMQAVDATSARMQATAGGNEVLNCTPRTTSRSLSDRKGAMTLKQLEIANLAYELSSLMGAGLSVMEGLRTLAGKERSTSRRRALTDVLEGINEGLPLSGALARHDGRFPPLLIATVSASEQTGDLATALRRYSEHQQSIKALRDKVVGAAIYPMLLLGIGLLVVMFLLGVVVPKFAVLIESTRQELPWSSRLMMSWGRMVAANAPLVAAASAATLVAIVLTVRHVARTGARSRWIEALPAIGPTIRQFRHAQLYRTTGMLVRGGIASPRALALAGSLLGEADRGRLDLAIALIREGRSMSGALGEAGLSDPVATSMLTVAERTGSLAEILERIAQFHNESLNRSVELTSRLFEPILMIVIGLVIGAIVVLMYLPIFDLASSLQ